MDDYGLELSGLDPDSIAELRRLRKEQRMAEAMMQQGEQPLRGQMVGGVYVRPSIFQGLAGMANTYAGNKRSQAVDEGYRSLSEKRKAVEAAAFDKFQQGFYGSPEKTEQLPEGMFGPPQTTPAVVPDMNSKQQAIIELLRSQSPTAKMVAPMMNQELNRQREQQEFRDALKGAAGGGQLTGFEPMQNGVPGQQGMVGDPQNLIQDIAMNPDMSNEDKQAAIAQIRQQSAGAGGGQIDTRAMLFSGNPKAMQVGQFLEGQQDKKTLAAEKAQTALEKQREHDRFMASIRGGSATTKAPSGYRYTPDGDLEAIKGGPADVKAQIQQQKEVDKAAGVDKQLDAIERNINKIMTPEGKATSGLKAYTGQLDQYYPEALMSSDTAAAGSALKSLQEQMTMMNLAGAKAAVGQSFGSMQVKEWDKFMNLLTNISRGVPDAEMESNVKFIRDFVKDKRDVLRTAIYGGTHGIGGPKPEAGGQSAAGNISAAAPQGIDPKLWEAMTPEEKALWK